MHKPAFHRVAIVNRGEPAVRLQHAVRELRAETGAELATIALYTEPDAHSMFVREADERHLLGPATFVDPKDGQRKSKYLDYEALEHALRETRADAAWVGWGFVAEHPHFADLCDRLGIVFIGPSGDVMRRLGDKIASKQLAEGAGVPVAPWSGGAVETLDAAREQAARLGYPLMIKATAGGGGRGIRSVRDDAGLAEAFESARSEALKAFGDGTVFMEKRVDGARHVEVQIVADQHGTTWAVGVRDCTIQRRNQKVLEEAPSPALDEALDAELRAAAIRLAQAADYRNAGTVECLFDPASRQFFFMEMNTRLQVEHPVTEVTTGIDLVKLQLLVASGYRLEGEPPATIGHAIEVRLNAEDPDNQFAPAPGYIDLFRLPTGPGLRVDTGVRQGDTVAPEFDSMIAKIIAHGRTRSEAMGRLKRALFDSAVIIRSGASNKAFLLELLDYPEVVASDYDIGWLDRTWAGRGAELRPLAHIALISAAIDVYEEAFDLAQTRFLASAARGRPAVDAEVGQSIELRCAGQSYTLDVRRLGVAHYRVCTDDGCLEVRLDRQGPFEAWITCAGHRHRVVSVVDGLRHLVEVDGIPHRVSRDEGGIVRAPSPAVTLAIYCKAGDEVRQGDRLMVLEAMKMEMGVVAPCSGRVREVTVLQNMQVNPGAPLVIIEPAADSMQVTEAPRVAFPADSIQDTVTEPKKACHLLLTELRRAVQGFDVTDDELRNNAKQRTQVCVQLPPEDETMWRLENDVLRTFADITWLFRRDTEPRPNTTLSGQESLHTYLRAIEAAGKGLSTGFLTGIERALKHYGVESLDRTPMLEEALVFLYKSQRRARPVAEQVFRVLERKLQFVDDLLHFATPEFREILDRLTDATMGRDLPLHDLAREVRYQFFDRPFFESARSEIYARIESDFDVVRKNKSGPAFEDAMRSLIASPQPLMGFVTSAWVNDDQRVRDLALTIMVRRLYRIRDIQNVAVHSVGDRRVAVASYIHKDRRCYVVATHATCPELQVALSAAYSVATTLTDADDVTIDLFTASDDYPVDLGRSPGRIRNALEHAGVASPVSRVVVAAAHPEHWRTIYYFTFDLGEQGYVEHEVQRGIHPMLAERLELWRLRNFKTRQLRARDDIYLFHATARDNPKDERLFAFVEVRDLTAVRDATGQIVQLPHLERVYTEALAGVRDFQSRRSARERLHWNRVVLYVWPEAGLSLRDVARVSKSLAPLAKGLGLEKAVVRIRLPEPESSKTRDAVIHISNRVGTGMHLRIDELSHEPIRPLSAYAQKVVRMRKMGLVYPYEIVRMLTPAKGREEAEFPHGTFQEYDLDSDASLVPVDRPAGQNRANVVVGVVTNFTTKHPEGMTRVVVLGDASREMAALAEPECLRIIKAIDLAESLQVPVEWFSVSSGAKIAMDVGTEGLDWVARVLRKLIEFTQSGGEVNVVVPGVNVGGQSYWNAEATMLMHTRGILVMTEQGSMVLTGKRALEYSGGVSADDNQGIGGAQAIMEPNGQAQYVAADIAEACKILFRHYDYTYVVPGESFPRSRETSDDVARDIGPSPHPQVDGTTFKTVGEVFSLETNPGRKKPFDIRAVMRATMDRDDEPLERWERMRNAENAVVWDAYLGGVPVSMIGIESRPLPRLGFVSGDGPDTWTGGTLFPLSSKKVARAINAASDNRPVVILANLSGFDGSPESMRKLQLEYGAEIGRAVVNFRGPIVFCVISRYHGGAYVVFSRTLNENMEAAALEGSHASVIGGAPAAAVVFPAEVKARTLADARVREVQEQLNGASEQERMRLRAHYDDVFRTVYAEKQGEVASNFDAVHCVDRAREVGSLQHIVPPSNLRSYLIEAVERGMARTIAADKKSSSAGSNGGRRMDVSPGASDRQEVASLAFRSMPD